MRMQRPMTMRLKYSAGPNLRANRESGGASSMSPTMAAVPAMKEPNAAMPRAGPARDVDEDGGRRASVHRAVVDAGQHDDGGLGCGLERHRQEQRHGPHGADARQHAHEGPDEDADEAVEEIDGLERDAEAEPDGVDDVHALVEEDSLRELSSQPQ